MDNSVKENPGTPPSLSLTKLSTIIYIFFCQSEKKKQKQKQKEKTPLGLGKFWNNLGPCSPSPPHLCSPASLGIGWVKPPSIVLMPLCHGWAKTK